MRHKMTEFPIGAMWEADTDNGRIGKIWLEKRGENIEMWIWAVHYIDNSGYRSDWCPSYRMCKNEIPLWNRNGKPIIFRRVK